VEESLRNSRKRFESESANFEKAKTQFSEAQEIVTRLIDELFSGEGHGIFIFIGR
jgi:hypothetical protein